MIRKAEKGDLTTLADLAVLMWSNHTTDELISEFSYSIESETSAFFIYFDKQTPIGFAQCSLRNDYVEGTHCSPVGYLEGVFIKKNYRLNGYAGELLSRCEQWAKSKGCKEFASDCEITNSKSLNFHLKSGFSEASRIICFTKKL